MGKDPLSRSYTRVGQYFSAKITILLFLKNNNHNLSYLLDILSNIIYICLELLAQKKIMAHYGIYIKELRQKQKLTLREVEAQTGVSNAYLSQLESGKIKQPSPSYLYKLAELYETTYEDLMERVGHPVPKRTEEKDYKEIVARNRLGSLSEEETDKLTEYLNFIRSQNK